jgi:hypothetical protein
MTRTILLRWKPNDDDLTTTILKKFRRRILDRRGLKWPRDGGSTT